MGSLGASTRLPDSAAWGPRHLHPSQRLQGLLLLGLATTRFLPLCPLLAGRATCPLPCPQDLKPGNLAVNEDCELKVCAGGGVRGSLPTSPPAGHTLGGGLA